MTPASRHDARRLLAECLRVTDEGVGRILSRLRPDDMFVITGDPGNDPTIGHDKHTREFTPLLVAGERKLSREPAEAGGRGAGAPGLKPARGRTGTRTRTR